jgi:hypothetical protein
MLNIWNPPVYGSNTQFFEAPEDSHLIPPKDVTQVQQLGGILFFYARVVDPILVMPVNVLTSEQKNIASTADKIFKLINYCTTHPDAKLRYHASDMI